MSWLTPEQLARERARIVASNRRLGLPDHGWPFVNRRLDSPIEYPRKQPVHKDADLGGFKAVNPGHYGAGY